MSPESRWARGQEAPPDVLPLDTTGWGGIRYTLLSTRDLPFASPLLQIPGSARGKEDTCQCRRPGSIPGSGRSPGGGHGNPLQYACLENPMGRGAWSTTVHRVTKSGTQLKQLSTHTHTLQIVPPSHRDSSCPLPVTSSPFLFMHFL